MGKVSIGLRGWRFDEAEVFTENGEYRPMDEMDDDTQTRLFRLSALVGSPCHACWLIHGDENIGMCNEMDVVYGEPLAEVGICSEHETDFLFWYFEEGGDRFRGEERLQDEFLEWFADGGRAPEGYAGVEHVDTDPDDLPEPPESDPSELNVELPEDEQERIDLRDVDMSRDYPS
ncbi:hypothetical protein [Haladaptatus sp. CMAA 1911]|uniref:hypothetical protein n=1 Tax=unclassified Haladaptatus TaxID=2622732 RepID=UPI0037544E38